MRQERRQRRREAPVQQPPPVPEEQVSPERGSVEEGAWKAGRLRAPRSCLLLRHLSRKRAWTLRPPAPVNAPCPTSLCWRRAPSQERGRFQTKPASRPREWCLRKPPSSRRPRPPRRSRPQAGPWPQRGPRPGCTQPRRSTPGGQQGAGPEKEPESSAGPLPWAGGLPPVTLQVRAPARMLGPRSPRRHWPLPPSAAPCSAPAPAPPPSA